MPRQKVKPVSVSMFECWRGQSKKRKVKKKRSTGAGSLHVWLLLPQTDNRVRGPHVQRKPQPPKVPVLQTCTHMQTATCAATAAAAERLPLHLLAHVSALMPQDAGGLFPGTDEAPAARLNDWKQLPGCEAAALELSRALLLLFLLLLSSSAYLSHPELPCVWPVQFNSSLWGPKMRAR